jgi:hypothetical protein
MFLIIHQFKRLFAQKKPYRAPTKKRALICIKQIKIGLVVILLITFFIACDKKEEPVLIAPYKQVGIINDLKGSIKHDDVYLTWGTPDGKDFPEETIKGFIIFISAIPEGVKVVDSECQYEPIDFILANTKPEQIQVGNYVANLKSTYEYIHNKAIHDDSIYLYKVIVIDKNNKIGKDSNIVSLKRGKDK